MQTQEFFTLKELYDIIQKQTEIVNGYWKFYISSIIFVIGFIITSENYNKIDTFQRIYLSAAFFIFALVCFFAIRGATTALAYFLDEFSDKAKKLPAGCFSTVDAQKKFVSFSESNKCINLVLLAQIWQIIGGLIVLSAINFPFLKALYKNAFP